MTSLHTLTNSSRGDQSGIRRGRGRGSGKGKTSGRGQKGAGSRSGYKRRFGYEGGQFPLYRKLPTRGFSNALFKKEVFAINLGQIAILIETGVLKDSEVINLEALRKAGYFKGKCYGLKILGNGELDKKVTIEAISFSSGGRAKLHATGSVLTVVEPATGKAQAAKNVARN